MRALSLVDTSDFGILRLVVDSFPRADCFTGRWYLVKSSELIPVVVRDRPGGLAAVLRILANAGIDVEYTHASVAHRRDSAYVILSVNYN